MSDPVSKTTRDKVSLLRVLATNAISNDFGTGTVIEVSMGYSELVAILEAAADALETATNV